MTVFAGDFYEIQLTAAFYAVCYWDGFGIGTGDDQQRLLKRIAHWLKPAGPASVEVGTPWYWANAAPEGWQVGHSMRRYGFDPDGCRMLDTWWPVGDESQAVPQSIRCCSPADLRLLLPGTGLALDRLEPTGAVNYRAANYPAGTYRAGAAGGGHGLRGQTGIGRHIKPPGTPRKREELI